MLSECVIFLLDVLSLSSGCDGDKVAAVAAAVRRESTVAAVVQQWDKRCTKFQIELNLIDGHVSTVAHLFDFSSV